MRIVRAGAGWRIEGAGKERARLAFANLIDDELVFSFEDQVSACDAAFAGPVSA
jgi:hypothetical protein